MKSNVVFFDIGNTLTVSGELSPRTLLAHQLDLSQQEAKLAGRLIMTHPATDPSQLASALSGVLRRHDAETIRCVLERVWAEQYQAVREVPGASARLEALKSRGLRIGVISNTWHPLYRGFCAAYPRLLEFIDYSVLSYRVGCKKPSPDIYARAVSISGEKADRCWMVGDSYEQDIEPARNVGMRTLWVLRRPEKERGVLVKLLRGEQTPPDLLVEDLNQIDTLLKRKGL